MDARGKPLAIKTKIETYVIVQMMLHKLLLPMDWQIQTEQCAISFGTKIVNLDIFSYVKKTQRLSVFWQIF